MLIKAIFVLQDFTAIPGIFLHASDVNGPISFYFFCRKNTSDGKHARNGNFNCGLYPWRFCCIKRSETFLHNSGAAEVTEVDTCIVT